MRRYVTHISFIPKIPLSMMKREINEPFCCDDIYLITLTKTNFIDFFVKDFHGIDNLRVHFSDPFIVHLNQNQINQLQMISHLIINSFIFRLNKLMFTAYDFFILPVVHINNQTDWDITIKSLNNFISQESVLDDYLTNFSKQTFDNFQSNLVSNFLTTVLDLNPEISIKDFISSNPIINSSNPSQLEMKILLSAIKFNEKYVDHMVYSSIKGDHIYLVKGIYFDINGSTVYREVPHQKSSEKFSDQNDGRIPFLSAINISSISNTLELNKFNQFPEAYGYKQERLQELLQDNQLIIDIYQRIGSSNLKRNFQPDEQYPLNNMFLCTGHSRLPQHLCSIGPILNKIADQMRPSYLGNSLIFERVSEAERIIFKNLGYSFNDHHILQEALTDATHPLVGTHFIHNYQRLEFLGDSILDFIVTYQLFIHYQSYDEGRLTETKHQLTSNNAFSFYASIIGLTSCVITQRSENYPDVSQLNLQINDHTISKSSADIFEAVFGAIFIDGGLKSATSSLQHFFKNFQPQLSSFGFDSEVINLLASEKKGQYISEYKSPATEYNLNGPLKAFIPYEIVGKPTYIFSEALTHSSYQNGNCPYNYERMEFLGDGIVKFAVGLILFNSYPEADEHKLSVLGSNFKSNDCLGLASFKLRLYSFANFSPSMNEIIFQNVNEFKSSGKKLSKIHGDLYESLIGALFLTKGINITLRFIYNTLFVFDVKNKNEIDPKTQMIQIIQKEFKITPKFFCLNDGDHFEVYLDIGQYRLPFSMNGKKKSTTEKSFSKEFLRRFAENDYKLQLARDVSMANSKNNDSTLNDNFYKF